MYVLCPRNLVLNYLMWLTVKVKLRPVGWFLQKKPVSMW